MRPFCVAAPSDLSESGLNEWQHHFEAVVQYRILTSTNLALPVASWTPVFPGVFANDGSYSYTNSSATNAASFFRLVLP